MNNNILLSVENVVKEWLKREVGVKRLEYEETMRAQAKIQWNKKCENAMRKYEQHKIEKEKKRQEKRSRKRKSKPWKALK